MYKINPFDYTKERINLNLGNVFIRKKFKSKMNSTPSREREKKVYRREGKLE